MKKFLEMQRSHSDRHQDLSKISQYSENVKESLRNAKKSGKKLLVQKSIKQEIQAFILDKGESKSGIRSIDNT